MTCDFSEYTNRGRILFEIGLDAQVLELFYFFFLADIFVAFLISLHHAVFDGGDLEFDAANHLPLESGDLTFEVGIQSR